MNKPASTNMLLVNADPEERLSLQTLLAPFNTQLQQVHSFDDALQKIPAADLAAVLVYLSPSQSDALEFARSVRALNRCASIPIVFLDAESSADFPVEQLYEFGAVEYLRKPVPAPVLRAKLALFLELFSKTNDIEARIKLSEDRYRTLCNSIDEGFCTFEMLFDAQRRPIDYRFIEANPMFEEQTGLRSVVGKTARELVPNLEAHWYERYGNVALTGEPLRFIQEAPSMGRWFDLYAFRTGGADSVVVAVLFKDITAQKRAELEQEKLFRQVQAAHAQMTEVFQKAPAFMCTFDGPQHVFKNVNENYFQLIGVRDVIGKTVSEALPEIVGQGYVQTLDEVYATGKSFVGKDVSVMLQRQADGPPEERIVDFVYLPLKDADEKIYGILVHGIDITERKRAEDELRRLATELAQSSQHKTEFLAILAHELRNPLAPIRNGLEVLRLTSDDPAAFAAVRDMMQRQVDQMVHLIDDLLDIGRISSGKLKLKKECVTLSKIVAIAIESCTPIIHASKHKLTVDIPDVPILLDADPTRLTQVLGNLLTNAARYTPSGGQINLSARVINNDVAIAVTDNGVGIPAESIASIFEMFTQVGNNINSTQGGLGIGLSLVHRLVELHGGTVAVQSEGSGKGSRFIVRLPLPVHCNNAQLARELTSPAVPAIKNKSLRILVADDNVDAAESLVNLFQLLGHQTYVAYDGIEAFNAVQCFVPDIAFIDIGMPGMNGHKVASAVKKQADIAHVVLIALTGWGAAHDRIESKSAGFDHHMTKPMDINFVKQLLADFV
ncbi:MAG TPA: ATP-binding protein [Cellvibrio sp.]|nr:ATP-binding protein [Cellvibrio sp.]